MEFEKFSIIFGILSEYFGTQPSKGLTKLYFESLKDWTDKDFEKACQILMKTRVYNGLPKIAEIIEALRGKPEDKAAIAYHVLVETMKKIGPWETVIFEDGSIGLAVDAMGGWEYVNGITIDEWKFRRKDFESLYRAHSNRGENNPTKCFGAFDRIKGASGQEGENKPILITKDGRFLPQEQIEEKEKKPIHHKVYDITKRLLER